MRMPLGCAWIALLALFLAGDALAQGGVQEMPSGKWWADRNITQELNLSPDQQSKIESLWMGNRRILIGQRAALERGQLDLAELLARDSIDEDAALKAFDRVAAARHNLERTTFLMRVQIKNLLSSDQQQKLEAIAQSRRGQTAKGNNTAGGNLKKLSIKKSGR
jgi:Spy/CpxP family protein refolding chaperone